MTFEPDNRKIGGVMAANPLRCNNLSPQVRPTLAFDVKASKTISLQQFNKLTSTVTSTNGD
jgi:hypothetical protein